MDSKQLLDLSLAKRLAGNGEAARIRQNTGLSLQDLADAIGGSPSGVHRWERAERSPRGALGAAYGQLLRQLQKVAVK